jgi:hypothetical protein
LWSRRGDGGVLDDGLDLGGEAQAAADRGVVERFDADAVAGQPESAAVEVPDREGEHALESLDAVGAPFLVAVHDDFGVGVAAEHVAPAQQFLADGLEVVDLAVEDDLDVAVLVGHGLAAVFGEVDDAQSAVAEGDMVVAVVAVLIRAAVPDGIGHFRDQLLIPPGKAGNSAHPTPVPSRGSCRAYRSPEA